MTESVATPAPAAVAASRRFRDYRVLERRVESAVITSFVLEPADGQPIPVYRPGQYLVFRFQVDGQPVLRNYSVSGDPDQPGRLRISVKHEKAPAGQSVPDGQGSSFLHTRVQVGDTLSAAGPMGEFVLDEDSDRPVVLLSGGVGLTPMLAMLHRLVGRTQRRVHFIHACENGAVHAFGDEVLELAARRSGVQAYFCYRSPDEADVQRARHQVTGLISREQLQSWLPLDDYEFYLCGPGGFMQANYRLLRSLGVARERIHYEFFGPATVLEETLTQGAAPGADSVAPELALEPVTAVADASAAGVAAQTVTFMPDGRQAQWHDDCESLLVLAEESGLNPDYNCRAGLCNTCMCTLVSGEVDYFEEPLDDVPAGKVLLCCSRPKGPVVVDLG